VRFIADMCMDVRVADWLNSHGHEATHLRDEGLQRLPNGEIFDKAITENRIVVTFDLDFGEIWRFLRDARLQLFCFVCEIREYRLLSNACPRLFPNVRMLWQGERL